MYKTRLLSVLVAIVATSSLAAATFTTVLSGGAENPPTGSAGTGSVTVDYDPSAHTLRVAGSFSGLTGNTTVAHIHCCVAPPGNAGVAAMTPTLPGFPAGVTAGAFDITLDLTLTSSFSPAFLTSSGGTAQSAEAALAAGLVNGQAYFNIHTTVFGSGEIRGFLEQAADASTDLQVAKTASPALVAPGQNVTYEVSITNAGPDDALNVELTDELSATGGRTLVSFAQTAGDPWSCAFPVPPATGLIICTRTLFPVAASATFQIVMNVDAATAPGTALANTAVVTSETADPNPANNTATAIATAAVSDLAVTKTASAASITADNDLTYTITLSQAGALAAANGVLEDALPAGTTFVSLVQSGPLFACTTPPAGTHGTITCTRALIEGGSATTFTIVTHIDPTFTGTLTNTATVSSDTLDANAANNVATAATVVSAPTPDLQIGKTVVARSPSQVTFSLLATNNGPGTATGVVITDALPAGLTLVSATPSAGSCSGTATVICNVGSLTAGSTASVTLIATITGTAAISNTATVTGNELDPAPANNSATASIASLQNVPSLSATGLMLMLTGLALAGWFATRAS